MTEFLTRPINAGKYRHHASIEQKTTTTAAAGTVETWQEITKAFIRIEPLRAREYWEAQKINPEITGKIYMRYQTGIPPGVRFVVSGGGGILHAVSGPVNSAGVNRELEFYYREELS